MSVFSYVRHELTNPHSAICLRSPPTRDKTHTKNTASVDLIKSTVNLMFYRPIVAAVIPSITFGEYFFSSVHWLGLIRRKGFLTPIGGTQRGRHRGLSHTAIHGPANDLTRMQILDGSQIATKRRASSSRWGGTILSVACRLRESHQGTQSRFRSGQFCPRRLLGDRSRFGLCHAGLQLDQSVSASRLANQRATHLGHLTWPSLGYRGKLASRRRQQNVDPLSVSKTTRVVQGVMEPFR